MVSHSPGGRLEHAHEHLHLSCGGGVYLRRLGVGNCRLNRGKRSFRANGREREREESIADSDCCRRRHGKDLWPYRMTMEKEESEAREKEGKLAKRFCFWSRTHSASVLLEMPPTLARIPNYVLKKSNGYHLVLKVTFNTIGAMMLHLDTTLVGICEVAPIKLIL